MKKINFIIIILLLTITGVTAQSVSFSEIITRINPDSLEKTMSDMEAFESRYAPRGNKDVAGYIINRLKQYGIDNAGIDSFYVEINPWFDEPFQGWMYNVKGIFPGNENRETTMIIGAHLDAISFNEEISWLLEEGTAGADDNASGIAVMLEIARLVHHFELTPKMDLCFMAYDGEELGLLGAAYDAQKRYEQEEEILLMINNDMVSYQPEQGIWYVDFLHYDNAWSFIETALEICRTYTSMTPYFPDTEISRFNERSDSWEYAKRGYKALYFMEHEFTPYYHTPMDKTEFSNMAYITEIAKLNFGLIYNYAFEIITTDVAESNTPAFTVNLFPNPASDHLLISIDDIHTDKYTFSIYDIYGRRYRQFLPESNTTKTDISGLAPGIYLLTVSHADGSNYNAKFVKR